VVRTDRAHWSETVRRAGRAAAPVRSALPVSSSMYGLSA
jgi:hypothetical protein